MLGRLQRIGRLEVRRLQEVTAAFGEVEDHRTEHEQEDADADEVLHRVIGMERNAIQRLPRLILPVLDLDTIGIVRAHLVQRHQMQHHQPDDHQRQGNDMQRKEAVQGDPRDQVVATYHLRQVCPDDRNRREQRDDHLRPPVGHLPPGQQIAHEGLGHQRQIDAHAEDPYQLARRTVGAIQQATEHVQIDDHEEGRGAGGMHVADQPAVLHIAHDVLDGGKGLLGTRRIAHRQPDAGQYLIDQHQQGQRAEEVEEVEVLRRVVAGQMVLQKLGGRQAVIDPAHDAAWRLGTVWIPHQAASSSTPTTSTCSLS